jgi:predicted TIM-barrel enzyme
LAFDLEDSLQMVEEAMPDVFCFHAGTTKGGLRGFDSGETIHQVAERSEEVYQKVLQIKPDLILIGHGSAMETPEDGQFMLNHTSGHGIWTGSSTERIPIEKAVLEAASQFTNLEFQD